MVEPEEALGGRHAVQLGHVRADLGGVDGAGVWNLERVLHVGEVLQGELGLRLLAWSVVEDQLLLGRGPDVLGPGVSLRAGGMRTRRGCTSLGSNS